MFYDLPNQDDTSYYIQIGFVIFNICTFITLFFMPAHYGRFIDSKRTSLVLPTKLAWILQEIPNIIVTIYYILQHSNSTRKPNKIKYIMIAPFLIHYIHRTFIFPFKLANSKNMPLEIIAFAATFTSFNSIMINRAIFLFSQYSLGDLIDVRFFIGLGLFCLGMYVNVLHDYSMSEQKKGKEGYIVPRGHLFEYVSSPNYFGEIIEWIGFAIATGTFAGSMFVVSTFCNLFPRAIDYHKWYRNKFGDEYPKNRKAIIPFLV
jgi:protein-S-isoprenylcysteine O-methyltransferase Ste14